MGSSLDEPERKDDERQHEVEVAPFALGKYALTFEEYDRFATAMALIINPANTLKSAGI